MTKTSHKKNRPFDFKLIALVEPQPVLYQRHWGGLSTYECMKEKTRVWGEIAQTMNANVDFCINRWNNLRGHYQRELRNCRELCPINGVIRGSTWPYLEAMKFLESTIMFNKTPKPTHLSKRMEEKQRQLQAEQEQQSSTDWDDCVTESESSSAELVQETLENEEFVYATKTQQSDSGTLYEQQTGENLNQNSTSSSNLQRMATLLDGLAGENRTRAERRIVAYLCKCQLRALNNEAIADLAI